jgi:transcriptional regulator with XRE-family HTH domain
MRRMLARLNLGAAMETFRLTAGMSQAEVGKMTGWSGPVISHMETGTRDTLYDIRNLLRVVDAFEVPREMLLPVILGHPAVFADRRIACAEAGMSTRNIPSATGYKPGEIMHIISGKLKARGFEVIERISGDEITEITVINPRNRRTGMVNVGYDGYVTWEWVADLKDRSGSDQITERIAGLLYCDPGPENGIRLVSGG